LVNLWIAPEGDVAKASRLPTGNVSFYSSSGNNVSWTPDGRIVFVSNEGGNPNIWITKPDGSERKQLTANDAANFSPVVSPDGKYIVFSVWRDGNRTLWRMNVNGSNPVQLTSGTVDSFPSISPDSRWIIYTAEGGAKPTLWKVSIDGGTPSRMLERNATMGVISPDGKYMAYTYPESADALAPPNRIAVIPFEGGEPIKTFQVQASGTVLAVIQWANDGKSLLYTVTGNNITNIWRQPLDGGPPKQATEFKEMLMTGFVWSHDGKQLACTRGNLVRDAVLIRDLK